MEHHWRRGPPQ